jgi:hypothetical protein
MQTQDTNNYSNFSESVYQNLPDQLREICELIEDPKRKDVFLIGILSAMSGAFSKYRFNHGTGSEISEYSPHLLSVIVGEAGSGKSLTRYGPLLTHQLDEQADLMNRNARAQYEADMFRYQKSEGRSEKPVEPPRLGFTASLTDSTLPGLTQFLKDNPGGCFCYDAELDGLHHSNAGSFGGFSTLLRSSFHHEKVSRLRKGRGESFSVERPRIACCLSGTPSQLRGLISSPEDGLFSRLLLYTLPSIPEPYRRMTGDTDTIGQQITALQGHIFSRSKLWSGPVVPLAFTERQEQAMEQAMADKLQVIETFGPQLAATWNRLPLICKRLAVTLSGFDGLTGEVLDKYFNVGMEMLKSLKHHAIEALKIIRQNNGRLPFNYDQYRAHHREGLNNREIAAKMGMSKETLYRNLKVCQAPGDTHEMQSG